MLAEPVAGASTPRSPMKRPRAFTASSENGSYYSLGGTGGRAKRNRAPSAASVFRIQDTPSQVLPTPNVDQSNEGSAAKGSGFLAPVQTRPRGMTESSVSPMRAPGTTLWEGGADADEEQLVDEHGSVTGTPRTGVGASAAGGVSRLMLGDRSRLSAPRESMEIRAIERGEQDLAAEQS